MSLTQCKECGEKISEKAKICPKCGAPQGKKQYTISQISIVIILVLLIYSSFNNDTKPSKTYTSSTTTKTKTVSAEKKAKLKECAKEVLERNEGMMYPKPAVGIWKMLNNIEVFVNEQNRVEVVYKTNHLFTHTKRKNLDKMQKIFMKNAGCSPYDLRTSAE